MRSSTGETLYTTLNDQLFHFFPWSQTTRNLENEHKNSLLKFVKALEYLLVSFIKTYQV